MLRVSHGIFFPCLFCVLANESNKIQITEAILYKKLKVYSAVLYSRYSAFIGVLPCYGTREGEVEKGVWRMPRLSQAMKDVISCDKPR